ncbi:MAG: hypothetical protein HDR44_01035 [Allobaculum sp.]|nr:hypothetical protein [Allobaculum sp.]
MMAGRRRRRMVGDRAVGAGVVMDSVEDSEAEEISRVSEATVEVREAEAASARRSVRRMRIILGAGRTAESEGGKNSTVISEDEMSVEQAAESDDIENVRAAERMTVESAAAEVSVRAGRGVRQAERRGRMRRKRRARVRGRIF